MTKKANIFANLYELSDKVRKIVEYELDKHDIAISYNHDDDADYNIVIGGDGTFIKAVHDSEFSEIPFLGINTGHLGFYNDITPEKVHDALDRLFNKDYIVNKLKVIECAVVTKDGVKKYKSINELVFKAQFTSIIRFDLYVDNIKIQSFAGDGVIFSTPSGSTAYGLSAGGSILYQDIDAFQMTPLAAIRSSLHRSLDKSLVVPKDTIIKLVPIQRSDNPYSLGIDGFILNDEEILSIDIKLSEKEINKIVFDKNWFWINIRDKFI